MLTIRSIFKYHNGEKKFIGLNEVDFYILLSRRVKSVEEIGEWFTTTESGAITFKDKKSATHWRRVIGGVRHHCCQETLPTKAKQTINFLGFTVYEKSH